MNKAVILICTIILSLFLFGFKSGLSLDVAQQIKLKSKIISKIDEKHSLSFYINGNRSFSIHEMFENNCWVAVFFKYSRIDTKHTDVFLRLNDSISVLHNPSEVDRVFGYDSLGNKIFVLPISCFSIHDKVTGYRSFLYFIDNKSFKGLSRVNIAAYYYTEDEKLMKDLYLMSCFDLKGMVYKYFNNFLTFGMIEGMRFEKLNTIMPTPQ